MNPIGDDGQRIISHHAGAPPLDWWNIPTQPYKGAHYATFPEELPRRLILAMCPTWVCRECGKPRRRIVETTAEYAAVKGLRGFDMESRRGNDSHLSADMRSNGRGGPTAQNVTLGWTDCGHDNYRPGIVLDPFAGSGTTLAVAQGLGRDSIGIDLDDRNADLARQRVGMFLEVEGDTGLRMEGQPYTEGSGWHRPGNRPEHPNRKLPSGDAA